MFRNMRRSDRELPREEAVRMLVSQSHGVLALNGDNGYPYAVPLSHVYHDGVLYFHGAREGYKADAVRAGDKASFCVVEQDEVQPEKFTTRYRSAIVFGRIRILEHPEEIKRAMQLILERFSPGHAERGMEYVGNAWDKFYAFAMTVEHITAKGVSRHGKE